MMKPVYLDFPMPNDVIRGEGHNMFTVVASVEYIDDDRGAIATVLLLRQGGFLPYFVVAHYALTDFTPGPPPAAHHHTSIDSVEGRPYKIGDLDWIGEFENIVPAVREYEQNGGDY